MIAKVGAYEVVHELKSGGMGSVLLGRRRGPGTFEQLVAIKTIRAELASAETVRAMFLDEAAILARLNHPGVATVHDFGEEDGNLYMVMEYVAGIPFRDLGDLRPPPGVAARAVAEACRGLHAAHEARDLSGHLLGLVHRDISPDNLLLGFDGHVKVIDFGIAIVKNRQAPVTEFGTVKGKPPYMSPEQVKNEPMDRRSDVFSLAVVLHELLTGKPLFDGDSIYAIARAVEHMPIQPPSAILGEPLPSGLDAAVMAALERDPARRTPTAAAFAEQLEQAIAASGQETLEAWAERELAGPRDEHRAWLSRTLSARESGTLLGVGTGKAIGHADTIAQSITPPPAITTELAPRPRRSLAIPALLGLVVLALVAVAIYVKTRRAPVAPAAIDAAIAVVATNDAPVVIVDAGVIVDAELVEAPADAPTRVAIVDAGVRRPPPRDAGVAIAPRDAAVAPPPSGTGMLTVKHKGDAFVNVVLDGKVIGSSPIFRKKLPAGKHRVELLDAKTGERVHEATIDVVDGKEVTVRP